jgi:hypothetical protein
MGCAAGDPQADRYVLLAPEARAAGMTLQIGDQAVTGALPIEVPAQAKVRLLGPSRDEPVTLAPGELVYVAGREGSISRLALGKEVAVDQVHLKADEGAAKELALQLGGRVATDTEGGWTLSVSEVFAATAAARVPAHLEGVAPVMVDRRPAAGPTPASGVPVAPLPARPIASPAAAPAPALLPASVPGSEPVDGLGPFHDAPVASPVAFLPAAGGCAGVGGTWRGRVYSDPHVAYYDFTLNVRQRGSSLQGNMVVEFWDAATDEVEPPSVCGEAQHVRVVESATGTVDEDGTMRLRAQGWQVSHHLCGEKVTEYSLDRVEIPLAPGATKADATISDDDVWADGMPIAMTRVGCEGAPRHR